MYKRSDVEALINLSSRGGLWLWSKYFFPNVIIKSFYIWGWCYEWTDRDKNKVFEPHELYSSIAFQVFWQSRWAKRLAMAILLVTSHQMKALQTRQIKPKKLAKLSKPSLSEFIEHFIFNETWTKLRFGVWVTFVIIWFMGSVFYIVVVFLTVFL